MPELIQFAQFGVAIFSVAIVYFIVRIFLDFLSNDMEHLRKTIEKHTEIDEKLVEVVKELLEFLRFYNGKKSQ
jgi:hypothetical protein